VIGWVIGYGLWKMLRSIEFGPSESCRERQTPTNQWSCHFCRYKTYSFHDLQYHVVEHHPTSGPGKELIERGSLTNGFPLPERFRPRSRPRPVVVPRWRRIWNTLEWKSKQSKEKP
jgi:hypothetical protein